jgi:lipid-A-disaccharide synthase
LPLAKAIKECNPNVQITYYILPQVWAWKAKRVAKVEKYCDNLASILPFEKQWYKGATYVGHPLMDSLPEARREPLGKGAPVAFLPGSRPKEIGRLMPIFRELTSQFEGEKLLAIPPFIQKDKIPQIYGNIEEFSPIYDAKSALLKSHFAFVCSGTATLEAALLGVPFVLAYKANPLDYFIAKRFVKLKYAGLANILFDFMGKSPLHVELLQDALTSQALLETYQKSNPMEFITGAKILRDYLKNGSASNTTKLIAI